MLALMTWSSVRQQFFGSRGQFEGDLTNGSGFDAEYVGDVIFAVKRSSQSVRTPSDVPAWLTWAMPKYGTASSARTAMWIGNERSSVPQGDLISRSGTAEWTPSGLRALLTPHKRP